MKMYWPRGFHKRVKQRCHSVVILNHYSLLFKSFCVTAAAHLLLCIKWYNTFLSNPSRKGIFNVILLLLYATVMDKLLFCFSNFLHLWCVFLDNYHHITLSEFTKKHSRYAVSVLWWNSFFISILFASWVKTFNCYTFKAVHEQSPLAFYKLLLRT